MKETFTNGPTLKKKKSKRLQKKSYSVCKANEFFFSQNIFKLFPTCSPLPLIRQVFGTQLSTNPSPKPPQVHLNYTDKEWWKKKKEAKNRSWISQQTLRLERVLSFNPLSAFIY